MTPMKPDQFFYISIAINDLRERYRENQYENKEQINPAALSFFHLNKASFLYLSGLFA